MKKGTLSEGAIRAATVLSKEMSGAAWAYGEPIAYIARGTIKYSPPQLAIPRGYRPELQRVRGYNVERLRPAAFRRVEYLEAGPVSLPIPSPEDAFILALKSADVHTAYHLTKNTEMDRHILEEAIVDEGRHNRWVQSDARKVLEHFGNFKDIAAKLPSHDSPQVRSIPIEDFEWSISKSYPSDNTEPKRWEYIDWALTEAERTYRKLVEDTRQKQRKIPIISRISEALLNIRKRQGFPDHNP